VDLGFIIPSIYGYKVTNEYGTGSVKYGKLATTYPWIYRIPIFFYSEEDGVL